MYYFCFIIMRNILVVFSDIYNLIPEEEIEFIKSMQNFRDTLRHSSPERLKDDIHLWHHIDNIINNNITKEHYYSKDWCKKIIDIYIDPNYR